MSPRLLVLFLVTGGLAVAVGIAAGASVGRTGAPSGCPVGSHAVLRAPASGTLLGAFASFSSEQANESVVTRSRVRDFELRAGRPLAWATFSSHWDGGRLRFPLHAVRVLSSEGVFPVVRMMPWSSQELGRPDPLVRLRDVADGAWDAKLEAYARAARDSGIALMIDFAPEANGDWFPWSGALSGGAAGARAYRDAFRRVVRTFRAVGAANVSFAFHVDAEPATSAPWNSVGSYYPGDAFVDWVGASVYGSDDVTQPWQPFGPGARRAAAWFRRVAPRKPFAVFEWGVVESPRGDKAAWIASAFRALRTDPALRAVRAVGWWDERWQRDDGLWNDLRISSSASALAAYRAGVASPRYVSTPALGCARDAPGAVAPIGDPATIGSPGA